MALGRPVNKDTRNKVIVHTIGNHRYASTKVCTMDAAEGMGSRFDGKVLGTFGKYVVLSFNGNKMITTSGGGALVCRDEKDANEIMWYATQAREAYPYYQHIAIGYNYRMSNVCAGIDRGQMTVLDSHIAHHRHVQRLYEELLADVPGVHIHKQPADARFDANFWLCAATLDPDVHIKGQEDAYKEVIKTAVGGAAGVIHAVDSATTDCQPNANVEALRVFMLNKKIEARPTSLCISSLCMPVLLSIRMAWRRICLRWAFVFLRDRMFLMRM